MKYLKLVSICIPNLQGAKQVPHYLLDSTQAAARKAAKDSGSPLNLHFLHFHGLLAKICFVSAPGYLLLILITTKYYCL